MAITITEAGKPSDVQITQQLAIIWPTATEMPSTKQLEALNALVKSKFPAFAANDRRELEHFWASFLFLFYARRRFDRGGQHKPDVGVAASRWCELANEWLEAHGRASRTTAKAVIAASIVHGIAYHGPAHASLALALGSTTKPQSSMWQTILERRQLPDPMPIDHPQVRVGWA
jgi:hypothetical protein